MTDDSLDYDVDSPDLAWIEKQPDEWKIEVATFEKAIAFLEMNCNTVLTLDDLLAQDSWLKLRYHGCEAIFDYWLNKRLATKRNFIPRLKGESKSKKLKNLPVDPYVVFRKNQRFYIHTRKNRKIDYEDYMILLHHRRCLAAEVKKYQELSLMELNRHDQLKDKLLLFIAECEGESVSGSVSNKSTFSADDWADAKKLSEVDSSDEDDYFAFNPQKGSKYLLPRNDDGFWSSESLHTENEKEFNQTPDCLMRQRMGRGGRIVFDRRYTNQQILPKQTFNQVDVRPSVVCQQLPSWPLHTSGTTFSLRNSSNTTAETCETLKFEFVSTN